jgi:hypothetical protein
VGGKSFGIFLHKPLPLRRMRNHGDGKGGADEHDGANVQPFRSNQHFTKKYFLRAAAGLSKNVKSREFLGQIHIFDQIKTDQYEVNAVVNHPFADRPAFCFFTDSESCKMAFFG